MNVGQLKLLSWVAVAGVGGYAGYDIYDFTQNRAELQKSPSEDMQKEVLDGAKAPPEEGRDIVPYDLVKTGFVGLNWTGKPDPVIVPVVEETGPEPTTPVTPVEDLLRVLFIRFDGTYAPGSMAVVKYIDPDLKRLVPGSVELKGGDRLPDPYSGVFVERIMGGAVVFGFDDEGRESETVGPARQSDREDVIAQVGEGGAVSVSSGGGDLIPRQIDVKVEVPLRTTRVGPGRFLVGSDDARYFSENWGKVVSEVQTTRYRNPSTGKYEGVKIVDVPRGSILERHGAQSGDIVKSVNGHPVSSKQEAIEFAKDNKDKYDTWHIVVDRLGREETIVVETSGE